MIKNSGRLKYLCAAAQSLYISHPKFPVENVYRTCGGFSQQIRGKKDDSTNLSSLFVPVPVKPSPDDINVGAELTGTLNKSDLLKVISKFYQKKEIKSLLAENGLDRELN